MIEELGPGIGKTKRKSHLVLSVLRNSLIGEYFSIAVVVHATVCGAAWTYAAFQEPLSIGLVLGCIWTLMRTSEWISASLSTFSLTLAFSAIEILIVVLGLTVLPNVGLLVAIQPIVCFGMLLFVLIKDVVELNRNWQAE